MLNPNSLENKKCKSLKFLPEEIRKKLINTAYLYTNSLLGRPKSKEEEMVYLIIFVNFMKDLAKFLEVDLPKGFKISEKLVENVINKLEEKGIDISDLKKSLRTD